MRRTSPDFTRLFTSALGLLLRHLGELRTGVEELLERWSWPCAQPTDRPSRPCQPRRPSGTIVAPPRRGRRRRASGWSSSATPGSVTPLRTSANGQPSAAANSPSVLQRSPTITAVDAENSGPQRARTSSAIGRYGLPAIVGRHPGRGADRGEDRPAARDRPVGRRVRGVVVGARSGGRRAGPRRWRSASARSRSRGGSPTTTASASPSEHRARRRGRSSASTTPGPPHTSTVSPGCTRNAAAWAEVSTSPSAGMPIAASAASWSATTENELLVTNSTRRPDARSRAIASGEPGIAWRDSQTTPSRSQRTKRIGADAVVHGARCSRRARPANLCRCPASNRSPRSATPPPRSTTSSPRRTTCCPTPTSTRCEARDPHNIVHVDVPRERDGEGRYEAAAALLRQWIADGVLVRDPEPSFTLYRMAFTDDAGRAREIVGVLGGAGGRRRGRGRVLPHERTTPKAKTDRLDLTRATDGPTSRPSGGCRWPAGSPSLLTEPGEPIASVHRRRRDAHRRAGHRPGAGRRRSAPWCGRTTCSSPTATTATRSRRTYRDEVRAATGSDRHAGRADARVRQRAGRGAAQRRRDPPRVPRHHDRRRSMAALATDFELSPSGPVGPAHAGRDGRPWLPVPRAPRGRRRVADATSGCVRRRPRLDGAWLEHTLAGTDADVSYQHGVHELHELLTTDPSITAAVLIRPGERRRDRAHRPRGAADAAEVDVLHAEAAHRPGDPRARLSPRIADQPLMNCGVSQVLLS